MRLPPFFLLLLSLILTGTLVAADRPNILWITSEDNAAQWLGCYGNPQAAPFKKQFARELRNPGAAKKAKGGRSKKTAE